MQATTTTFLPGGMGRSWLENERAYSWLLWSSSSVTDMGPPGCSWGIAACSTGPGWRRVSSRRGAPGPRDSHRSPRARSPGRGHGPARCPPWRTKRAPRAAHRSTPAGILARVAPRVEQAEVGAAGGEHGAHLVGGGEVAGGDGRHARLVAHPVAR